MFALFVVVVDWLVGFVCLGFFVCWLVGWFWFLVLFLGVFFPSSILLFEGRCCCIDIKIQSYSLAKATGMKMGYG